MGGRHARTDSHLEPHAAERRLVAGVRADQYAELLVALRAGPALLEAAASGSARADQLIGDAARLEHLALVRAAEILAGRAQLSPAAEVPLPARPAEIDSRRRFLELRARLVELLELADDEDRGRRSYHPALEREVGLVHVAALVVAQDLRHIALLETALSP